jgi:tetratricopeptide (TPR) repeat protein
VTDCSIRVSSAAGIDWQPITNINDQIAAVQDSLDAIINDSNLNPKLAEELVGANGTLQDAITELGSGNTQAGLQRLEQAMSDIEPALEAAVADGSLDASQANQIMNDLALVAQRIAVQAIEDAQERGGDPTQIEEAQLDLDDGDALRESGAYMEAVDKYKDALAKAEGA